MKTSCYFGLACVVLTLLFGCSRGESGEAKENLTVAFISHTYYVNRHKDVQQMFIDDINKAKPKYIFAMGDIVLLNRDNEWAGTLEFFSKFDAQVYYVPGNHDIFNFDIVEGLATDRHYPEWRQQYVDRIGYAHKMIRDDQADFVLINSNDPASKITPFLDESLSKANPKTPTLLLSHHRIWLERYQENWVQWYWKSAKKEELLPYISKFDQVVIGDLWGKYEMKSIENTPTAMIGMGNNDKPAFWVYAELKGSEFAFEQRTITLPEGHPFIHKKK
ncbi:MAG: hypothetical protein COA42_12170 [Alteromonadaceae bacterium]|nr:MAG: hypothetical protein COA42_12170 [Alteromonadaceae bacterium]